jgi:hypothetical protein
MDDADPLGILVDPMAEVLGIEETTLSVAPIPEADCLGVTILGTVGGIDDDVIIGAGGVPIGLVIGLETAVMGTIGFGWNAGGIPDGVLPSGLVGLGCRSLIFLCNWDS